MADTNIERGINMKLRTKQPMHQAKDRRWLTECRVITGADVEILKAAGGVVGMKKAEKAKQKKAVKNRKGKAPTLCPEPPQTPLQPPLRAVHITSASPEEWFEILSESDSSSSPASLESETIIVAIPKVPGKAPIKRQLFPQPSQASSSVNTMSLRPRG